MPAMTVNVLSVPSRRDDEEHAHTEGHEAEQHEHPPITRDGAQVVSRVRGHGACLPERERRVPYFGPLAVILPRVEPGITGFSLFADTSREGGLQGLPRTVSEQADRGHLVEVDGDRSAPAAVTVNSIEGSGILRPPLVSSSPLVTASRCPGSTVTRTQDGEPS